MTTHSVWIMSAALTALILLGCETTQNNLAEANAESLDQRELERMFENGVRAQWRDSNGYSGTVVLYPDGRAESDWGSGSGEGTYAIRDGRYCDEWASRRVRRRCFTVYPLDGELRYRLVSGNYSSHWTVVGTAQ